MGVASWSKAVGDFIRGSLGICIAKWNFGPMGWFNSPHSSPCFVLRKDRTSIHIADSRYAFGTARGYEAIYWEKGFLIIEGKTIKNKLEILDLLAAIWVLTKTGYNSLPWQSKGYSSITIDIKESIKHNKFPRKSPVLQMYVTWSWYLYQPYSDDTFILKKTSSHSKPPQYLHYGRLALHYWYETNPSLVPGNNIGTAII